MVESNKRAPLLQISRREIEDKKTQELFPIFGLVHCLCINENVNNQMKK